MVLEFFGNKEDEDNSSSSTKDQMQLNNDYTVSDENTDNDAVNVIAFSLYGNSNRYWGGVVPNAKLAVDIYLGWKVCLYHDSAVPKETLDKLNSIFHVELYEMKDSSEPSPMMFCFLVTLDPKITGVYIVRDVDSRLNHRERSAVKQWLQ